MSSATPSLSDRDDSDRRVPQRAGSSSGRRGADSPSARHVQTEQLRRDRIKDGCVVGKTALT